MEKASEKTGGNLDLYNRFSAPPKEALTPITGGRLKGMSDINPMWRIKCLTEMFGPCGRGWTYEIKEHWTEAHGEEVAVFVVIELRYTYNNDGPFRVTGTGGSMVYAQERNGMHLSDEAYKMAVTDALGVCCKQLGIAADVYWSEGTKYLNPADEPRGLEQAWSPTRSEMLAVMNWFLSQRSMSKIRAAWMENVRRDYPDAQGFEVLDDVRLAALYSKVHESIVRREAQAKERGKKKE